MSSALSTPALDALLHRTRRSVTTDRVVAAVCRATFWTSLAATPLVATRFNAGVPDLPLVAAVVGVAAITTGTLLWGRRVRSDQLAERLNAPPDAQDRVAASVEFLDDNDPFKQLAVRNTETWLGGQSTFGTLATWPAAAAKAVAGMTVLILAWLFTPGLVAVTPPSAASPATQPTTQNAAPRASRPTPPETQPQAKPQTSPQPKTAPSPLQQSSSRNETAPKQNNGSNAGGTTPGGNTGTRPDAASRSKGSQSAGGNSASQSPADRAPALGNGPGQADPNDPSRGSPKPADNAKGPSNTLAADKPADKGETPSSPDAGTPSSPGTKRPVAGQPGDKSGPPSAAGTGQPNDKGVSPSVGTPGDLPGGGTPSGANGGTPASGQGGLPGKSPAQGSKADAPAKGGSTAGDGPAAKDASPLTPAGRTHDLSAGRSEKPGQGSEEVVTGEADGDLPTANPTGRVKVETLDPGELDQLPPERRRVVLEYFRRSSPAATRPANP